MGTVHYRQVGEDEANQRLDRWFSRHFGHFPHTRLERMLRKGEIRVDGERARAGRRLQAGQSVRIPPLDPAPSRMREAKTPHAISEADRAAIHAMVIYRDRHLIALNKPRGLAVQGGSRRRRHLELLTPALVGEGEAPPRLVHRLDAETSGLLLLALSARSAAALGQAFRARVAEKLYWAALHGVPDPPRGRLKGMIHKTRSDRFERMAFLPAGAAKAGARARLAITEYRLLDQCGKDAAWVALRPVTGRTHQLRAHMASIGHPVLGDTKYAGTFPGRTMMAGNKARIGAGIGLAGGLHLHATALRLPHPAEEGRILRLFAPLPEELALSWRTLGWDAAQRGGE